MKPTETSRNTCCKAHKEEMAVCTERGNLFVKRTDCRVHGEGANYSSGPLQRRHTTAATRVSESVDNSAMLDPDYALLPFLP